MVETGLRGVKPVLHIDRDGVLLVRPSTNTPKTETPDKQQISR